MLYCILLTIHCHNFSWTKPIPYLSEANVVDYINWYSGNSTYYGLDMCWITEMKWDFQNEDEDCYDKVRGELEI